MPFEFSIEFNKQQLLNTTGHWLCLVPTVSDSRRLLAEISRLHFPTEDDHICPGRYRILLQIEGTYHSNHEKGHQSASYWRPE